MATKPNTSTGPTVLDQIKNLKEQMEKLTQSLITDICNGILKVHSTARTFTEGGGDLSKVWSTDPMPETLKELGLQVIGTKIVERKPRQTYTMSAPDAVAKVLSESKDWQGAAAILEGMRKIDADYPDQAVNAGLNSLKKSGKLETQGNRRNMQYRLKK